MIRFRYTAWDGSRRVQLDPDRVFERLAEYLSETDDLGEALDRLLRSGLSGEEFEVVGVDELVAELRRELQKLYDTYNLDHALERQNERLDDAVGEETSSLDRVEDEADRTNRSGCLSRLPRALDDALDRLSHYNFVSRAAAAPSPWVRALASSSRA